ncbi:hypothetical protein GWK08_08350 [Leptobacterium flavescens]|uniref:tRNA_anti-like n=1 Tax=Leptobacterium flavescens TaxID=472055 RepID=A0A6P0URF4_9FLAO|nr:hypothetical protein [Leptobacterium flavescens]NER13443.1 hypothetical protein [Leptobacterium flavescens]
MKKQLIKNIAILFFVGLLILYAGLYRIFFKEVDMIKTPAEIRISSEHLVASFLANEPLANNRYVEKVIEVQGIIDEITYLNDRYTVFLQGGDKWSCLMCDMQPDQIEKVKKLKPGQKVLLKGICKGFLKDAILLNCVLLNQKINE